jgi:hypothetical protein
VATSLGSRSRASREMPNIPAATSVITRSERGQVQQEDMLQRCSPIRVQLGVSHLTCLESYPSQKLRGDYTQRQTQSKCDYRCDTVATKVNVLSARYPAFAGSPNGTRASNERTRIPNRLPVRLLTAECL